MSETPAGFRNAAIDAFRAIAAVLVIVLHSIPASLPGEPPVKVAIWATFASLFGRAAVPFFFIVSGYFLRPRTPAEDVIQPLKRIVPIFMVWTMIYALFVMPSGLWRWTPSVLIGSGAAFHLWFLPALAGSMILVSLLLRLGRVVAGLAALAIALAGPIAFAYQEPLGLGAHPQALEPLVRQMSAPLFVFIGVALQKRGAVSPWVALAMLGGGVALLAAEQVLVSRLNGSPVLVSYDVLFATFLLGTAAFQFARSLEKSTFLARLATLGRLSLAVYLVHLIVVWTLVAVFPRYDLAGTGLRIAIAVLASFAIAAVLVRIRPIRRLVM